MSESFAEPQRNNQYETPENEALVREFCDTLSTIKNSSSLGHLFGEDKYRSILKSDQVYENLHKFWLDYLSKTKVVSDLGDCFTRIKNATTVSETLFQKLAHSDETYSFLHKFWLNYLSEIRGVSSLGNVFGLLQDQQAIPHKDELITTEKMLDNQGIEQGLQKTLFEDISKGYRITFDQIQFLKLFLEKNKSSVFESKERIKQYAEQAIRNFFKETNELDREIKEVIKEASKEKLERALFDKTLLPIGLKAHTGQNSSLSHFLKKTGGFVAHGQDTCFVANPVANAEMIELCLAVLEKKKKSSGINTDPESYYQACIPQRLDNEGCGIATLAFMLSRTKTLQYTPAFLDHNQGINGVTIYDAGQVVVGKHFVPGADGKSLTPHFAGRTDMLLCGSIEDIKNAQMILSLLVHATYQREELKHQKIGQQFTQEFKDLLQKHGYSDWLENKFVDIQDSEKSEGLGSVMIKITEHRNHVNERTKHYNSGVLYVRDEQNIDLKNQATSDLRSIYEKEIQGSLQYEVKALLEKYRNLLYPKGSYVDERDYLFSDKS